MHSTKMKVMAKVCNKCLLSKARIVASDRVEDILDQCNETGGAFECHKASKVVCRAFFDGNYSLVVRLAKMWSLFEFVEPGC